MKIARLFAFVSLAATLFAAMLAPTPASAQWGRWHHAAYHRVSHHRWHRHRVWRNHHWVWVRW